MSDATKLPTSSELLMFQWSRPEGEAPKLGAGIDEDDTILKVTVPLKDEDGNIITGGFLMGIRQPKGWTETCWVPVGAVSADGLTIGTVALPVIRGIDPGGIDYTVGNTNFTDEHDQDEPVFCNIPAQIPELIRSVLQGLIASGGSSFIMGTDADGTVTIKRSTGAGTSTGFMRWNTSTDKTEYSNDGSSWTAIDDTVSSVLFKISATDTTPAYALTKITGGTGITVTQTNTGGNESLVITTSLPDIIDAHATYTPAYLTGGTSAQSNVALWDSVSDGSFRITVDGTAYNIDGIDFTAPVTSMAEVAAAIQVQIRAGTGGTETVAWNTNKFIITSGDTTSSSAILVLETSTGTVGTDISGAGASDWMDCDTGNGTVTAKVLDPTADVGALVKLLATGLFDVLFMPTNLQEANTVFGNTDITGAQLETLSDGSVADDEHIHNELSMYRQGRSVYSVNELGVVAAAGSTTTAGCNMTATTQAANNAFGGISVSLKDKTVTNPSVHNKNPEFWMPVEYNSDAAQDGFIGFVNASFTGASVEDAVMTLDHFGFIIADGVTWISCANGTTQTKEDVSATITDVSAGAEFWATFDGTTATFYYEGSVVGTPITANVPNGTMESFQSVVIADATAAAKIIRILKTGRISYDK